MTMTIFISPPSKNETGPQAPLLIVASVQQPGYLLAASNISFT
jgi:hypothetical protein